MGERGVGLARAHGVFNLVGGVWPLVHMRSFEFVFGPKRDKWLVCTVAGLLVGVGWSQLRVAPTGEGVAYARRIGVAAAATLLTVELYYVPRGVIRPTYLVDSVLEAAWIRAWSRHGGPYWRPRRP